MKNILVIIFLIAANKVSADDKSETEKFVCNPPSEIKQRVNLNCILAIDKTREYKKPVSLPIKNGKLFIRVNETHDGQTHLKLSHQCKKKSQSKWQDFHFCGFQRLKVDRETAAIKEIRTSIAKENKLTEKFDQDKIDEIMMKEINPWIAEPLENIREENGAVKISILAKPSGTACFESQELTYLTNCK
ncbi:hypothetical protein K2X05_12035 [bacterium]|nr:hypothetical protein [bacterium]